MNKPLTVGELISLLKEHDPVQMIVFSDVRYGDFNVIGDTGTRLSEDNFDKDVRPIFRLEKRA